MWPKKRWRNKIEKPLSEKEISTLIESNVDSLRVKNADILFRWLDDDDLMEDVGGSDIKEADDLSMILLHFTNEASKKRLVQATSVARTLFKNMPKHYKYHNKAHTFDQVVRRSMSLASQQWKTINQKKIGNDAILESDKELLYLAALFHDIWFLHTPTSNECRWAMYAERVMRKIWYQEPQIDQVKQMIMATDIKTTPKNLLEEILRDADMAHLADPFAEFIGKAEALYDEYRKCNIIPSSESLKDRMTKEPEFLEAHTYYSEIGKYLLDERKRRNIEQLEEYVKKTYKI